jgi:cellulose synthase/poly-beta-1,6-N-acetylglucosamine synthase-like glycosyltransferase
MDILLWICLIYILYVEVGYLGLLWVVSVLKRQQEVTIACSEPLDVTILLAVHNEERVIRHKLENILALDYPHEKLQVVVVSDNSTDRTDLILDEYDSKGVILYRMAERGGKIAALRGVEGLIAGEIVVFTDADATFRHDAIQALVRHFGDPSVGAVSGRETRPASESIGKGKGEGLFNRIENLIKTYEGKVGNQVMVHGGIFAVRRELLPFVPDYLSHDAIVPLQLTLQGYRTIYEPDAVSIEPYELETNQDWQRRVRTVLQSIQSYLYVKEALNPFKTGFYALQIWSHRFARWFVFPVLIVALISNLVLARYSIIYLIVLAVQISCYFLALIGLILDKVGKRPGIFYYPFYFVYIHMAVFQAVMMAFWGKKIKVWEPTERSTTSKIVVL